MPKKTVTQKSAIPAQPLLERWNQQAAMFKEFEAESDSECPPEMIKRSEYYRDLAQHIRAHARELKALLHGPE